MKKTIEVFSIDNCKYCEDAKRELTKRWREGISIVDYNISQDSNNKKLLLERLDNVPKRLTAPQIFIDSQHIGGYTELMEYFQQTDWN